MTHGKEVYDKICTTCHQPDGRGMAGVFPPLAQSDFLMHDSERAIRVLIEGLQGPITVNGQTFNGVMPNFSLTDDGDRIGVELRSHQLRERRIAGDAGRSATRPRIAGENGVGSEGPHRQRPPLTEPPCDA